MTTATKDFESTRNPSEGLNSIDSGNLDQQQTPVDKNSASTAINSSKKTLSEEVDTSQKYDNKPGESDMYDSTASSGHIDANTSLPAPENTTPVSTELDKGGEEGFEDVLKDEDVEDDDFPVFEGGEPRGRIVNPVAGNPGPRPVRPRPR